MSAPTTEVGDLRACPVCRRPGGEVVHVVPDVPVHSCLVMQSQADARAITRGALAIVLCHGCGTMSNRLFAEQDMAYSARYEDSQAFSATFLRYAEGLAARWIDDWGLAGRTVLEIGAGRGDFSRLLAASGAGHVVAMDPTVDPGRFGEPDGRVTLVPRAFDADTDLSGIDAVTMRHVLEHVDDPGALLRDLRRALDGRPDVPVLVELPEAGRILDEGAFWDMYHEHCNYLVHDVAVELFESAGFELVSTALGHADQYLHVEALPTGRPRPMRLRADALAATVERVSGFRSASREHLESLRDVVVHHARSGRVVLWGSGSKGTAFLHALGPAGWSDVDAVVDVNPHLSGAFVAGTGHPILSPESLAQQHADLVVAMNPVYHAEIRDALDRLDPGADLVSLGTVPG